MLGDFVEFSSREGIVDLIVECLNRPAGDDLPVILVLGARGSGKTALLDDIHRSCSGVKPCAMRRLGPRMERPHEVAVQLAFGLSERARQFGRLRFPRLMLGLVVTRNIINQQNRDTARSDLRGLLDNSRKLMTTVRKTGDGLLKGLGAPRGRQGGLRPRTSRSRGARGRRGSSRVPGLPGIGRHWAGGFRTRWTP